MKKSQIILTLLLFSFSLTHAQNPYTVFGVEGHELLTDQEKSGKNIIIITALDSNSIAQRIELDFNKYEVSVFDKQNALIKKGQIIPQIPKRWTSLDPLKDKHPNLSPYHGFNNNPILNIDPDGRDFFKNNKGDAQWFDNDAKEFSVGEDKDKVNWSNIGTELLEFNGKTLKYSWQVTDDKEKRIVQSNEYQAVSGTAKPIADELTGEVKLYFEYSKERQQKKSEGPIPEGLYSISKRSMTGRNESTSVITSIFRSFGLGFNEEAWGDYRWSIQTEQANTYGRGGFFVHGGWEWGSIGCIDLTGGINNFTYQLFNNDKPFDQKTYLKVSYSNNSLFNINPINPSKW